MECQLQELHHHHWWAGETPLYNVSGSKIKQTHGKNIVDDRLPSRSGFTAVPQQSAGMSWLDGSGSRLFEETCLAQWPLKCPAEADKRSQVQWKNPHVITTRGRYGVSHYCQESVTTANSSANTSIALLYGVKWCMNFLDGISIFFDFVVLVTVCMPCYSWRFIFSFL